MDLLSFDGSFYFRLHFFSYLLNAYGVTEKEWKDAPEMERLKEISRFFGELPERYETTPKETFLEIMMEKMYLYEDAWIGCINPARNPLKEMMRLDYEDMITFYPEVNEPQRAPSIASCITVGEKEKEEETTPVKTMMTFSGETVSDDQDFISTGEEAPF